MALAEKGSRKGGKGAAAQPLSRVLELRAPVALTQDPHAVRDTRENVLEIAIGREVRNFRRQQGMTVADLANVTGLSIGMLSKIENGNTSPSLTTLSKGRVL